MSLMLAGRAGGFWLLLALGWSRAEADALGLGAKLFNLPDPFPLSSVYLHSCSCQVGKTYIKTALSHCQRRFWKGLAL